jgi:glycosyltransferase involved in cell wall biosynthesis
VPRISVIIPCFNQGEYLDEAVDSVLAQTLQDFEILIVDDGSTDEKTTRLLADYRRPNTRVWRTPNRGLAAARNFLIGHATGAYLCALDADDHLHPEYLAKARRAFDEDPGLTFVSAWLQEFGTHDGVWRQDRCDLTALLAEDTVMTAALVRRDVVLDAGGYDEHMPAPGDEDWDLWIRLVKAGHRGAIIPEVLFYYRRRPDSMSSACTRGQTHLALVRYLFRKHETAYRAHLRDVLLWQDQRIARALRQNDARERERDGSFRTDITLLEAERDRLASRRDEALDIAAPAAARPAEIASPPPEGVEAPGQPAQMVALQAECDRAREEVRALRASASWRVTAPLRRLYDARPPLRRRRSS